MGALRGLRLTRGRPALGFQRAEETLLTRTPEQPRCPFHLIPRKAVSCGHVGVVLISLPPSKPRLSEPTTASAFTDCESITPAVGSASRPSLSRILDCSRLCELAVRRANLARDSNSEAYQFLFHVYGLAGVGKSTLIRRWEAVAREEGAITAVVGEEAVSAVEAMEVISSRLARQGCPLKAFDKQLSYRLCDR